MDNRQSAWDRLTHRFMDKLASNFCETVKDGMPDEDFVFIAGARCPETGQIVIRQFCVGPRASESGIYEDAVKISNIAASAFNGEFRAVIGDLFIQSKNDL